MTQDKLIEAAKAVIARWDSPNWKDATHTADYIQALRYALNEAERYSQAQPTPSQSEPVGEVGYLDDELVGYLRSDIEIPHGTKLYTKPQPTTQDVLNAIEQAKIDYAYVGKSLEWRRGFDAAMKEIIELGKLDALLNVAMQTLEQIATTPRNKGARQNANGTLRFLQTQMQKPNV